MLKHLNTIWLLSAVSILCLLYLFTDWLTRDAIAGLLASMGPIAFAVYIVLSLTRSLALFPCSPFILAGAITFPQWPMAVFIISMIGIVVGASLIYSFPSFGGYDRLLEEKYPEKIAGLKQKMHGRFAFWIVTGWSFFPLVPTDAVCYAAGISKMPLRKMLAAVVLGELPLVTAYVFLGAEIGEWLRV